MVSKDSNPRYDILVPALDALVGDPSILEPALETPQKAERLIIPAVYIPRIKDFREEMKNRGEAAKILLHSFAHILEIIQESGEAYKCPNGMMVEFCNFLSKNNESTGITLVPDLRNGGITEQTIRCALKAKEDNPKKSVAILTGEDATGALASLAGIKVAEIEHREYTGRRKLTLPLEAETPWFKMGYLTESQFKEFFPDEPELMNNEFVEFELSPTAPSRTYQSRIGRVEQPQRGETERCVQQLHYIDDLPSYIQPRTVGQAMLAEALMAPVDEIPIVICPAVFGTGKTYLTIAIGMYLTVKNSKKKPAPAKDNTNNGKTGRNRKPRNNNNANGASYQGDQYETSFIPRFERIFVCPRESELGKEIGFLPGDEFEKTKVKAQPIIDNLRAYLKNKGDRAKGGVPKSNQELKHDIDNILAGFFEFVSLINMGGRSISDAWIIYDEAQDMERFQINQLMKRIGDRSKMIITGDPSQIYNHHLNKKSNGLSYAASHMAGSPLAAVITMTKEEITRSTAAQEIARCFEE